MHHEETGSGTPVVLVHAGIADSRMWEPQWRAFADDYRLVRLDLPGFGRTPIEVPQRHARDVLALVEELELGDLVLVGCSMGGRVCLELAVARPDLVRALVLVDSGLPGGPPSDAIRAYADAEDEAVSRGDLDAAVEENLRMWVDGPGRAPDDVDPAVRGAVAEMVRRSLELHVPRWEEVDEELLVPDVADRLGEVRAPTLVVVGDEDVDHMQAIARRLASEIPRARLLTIAGAAHFPSLEQPAVFDEALRGFLAEALS
jgi:pimeloyl-ACP methyl ester carboxylesterase